MQTVVLRAQIIPPDVKRRESTRHLQHLWITGSSRKQPTQLQGRNVMICDAEVCNYRCLDFVIKVVYVVVVDDPTSNDSPTYRRFSSRVPCGCVYFRVTARDQSVNCDA